MRKPKMRVALILVLVIVASAMTSAFAYFTDRETAEVTATAGTLQIELAETWNDSNPERENSKPGHIFNLDYTITNTGNKSADVRETFVIRSDVPMSNTAPEFEIYAANDVELITTGVDKGLYAPKASAYPIVTGSSERVISADKTKITYYLPEFTIDGTGTAKETGDASQSTNGSTIQDNVKTGDYVILFAKEAGNAFQGVDVTIDYLAEAKQHRNTDETVWSIVASETITFAGDAAVKAVPVA